MRVPNYPASDHRHSKVVLLPWYLLLKEIRLRAEINESIFRREVEARGEEELLWIIES